MPTEGCGPDDRLGSADRVAWCRQRTQPLADAVPHESAVGDDHPLAVDAVGLAWLIGGAIRRS